LTNESVRTENAQFFLEITSSDMDYLPIIRTPAGGWVAPRDVLVIPTALQYRGSPLFKSGNCADRNSPYTAILPESDYDVRFLEALGARIFNKDDVRAILSAPEFSFETKGYGWIAALFGYLHTNPSADPTSSAYLHLETGEWTAPHVGQMYIGESADIPFDLTSVNISILNREFVAEISKIETARLYLTERLNIRMLQEETIINAIFDRHARGPTCTALSNQNLDEATRKAHAQYLSGRHHLIDWEKWSVHLVSPFYVVAHDGRIREAKKTTHNKIISKSKNRKFSISAATPSARALNSCDGLPEILAAQLGSKPYLALTKLSAASSSQTEPDEPQLAKFGTSPRFSRDEHLKLNLALPYYLCAIWSQLPLEMRQNTKLLRDLKKLLCPSSKKRYYKIYASIAIHDSLRRLCAFLPRFDRLNFDDLTLEVLIQILKCAPDTPAFRSVYGRLGKVSIVPVEPITPDKLHTKLVMKRRASLARYALC
jgi:hypothetical protein